MPIQHVNIADANRHEDKHASTASNGQVKKANGDGTTAFVNPVTLNNVTIASTLEAFSTATQAPTATNTALQVTFGSGASNSDVEVSSAGVVTIKTAGLYLVEILLNVSRETSDQEAIVMARTLVNDVAVGTTASVVIDSDTMSVPVKLSQFRKFTANDTLKVQIIRDDSGEDDGGLFSIATSTSGWAASPSAYVKVQKIGGGF